MVEGDRVKFPRMAYHESWGADEPKMTSPRVSTLAVLSILCGIVCVPGLGVLAVLLGGLALASISRNRLSGKAIAAVGIVLGLLATSVWTGFLVGAVRQYQFTAAYANQAAVVLTQIESGQADLVRPRLAPEAGTDERLAAFRKHIADTLGAVKGSELGSGSLDEFLHARSALGAFSDSVAIDTDWPIPPLPIRFERGLALVTFESRGASGAKFDDQIFDNIMILAPGKPAVRLIPLPGETEIVEHFVPPDAPPSPAPSTNPSLAVPGKPK